MSSQPSKNNQLKSKLHAVLDSMRQNSSISMGRDHFVKLWLFAGFNSNVSLESLWGHLKLAPNFEIRSKTWLTVRFMYWRVICKKIRLNTAVKMRNFATILIICREYLQVSNFTSVCFPTCILCQVLQQFPFPSTVQVPLIAVDGVPIREEMTGEHFVPTMANWLKVESV